jgi:hypothetical protein
VYVTRVLIYEILVYIDPIYKRNKF